MATEVKQYAEPWISALLKRDHNLSLQFADGWVHGRVRNVELTQGDYDRVDALATISSDSTIGGSGSTGVYWNTWDDANSFDYFKETRTATILQSFIGIWPTRLRYWKQYADYTPGRLDKIVVKGIPDKDTIGYINGMEDVGSPLYCPTILTQSFIPPQMAVKHAIFNPELGTVSPFFKLIMNRMEMKIYNPEEKDDLAKINKIITGKDKTTAWTPGLALWQYNVEANLGVKALAEWREY